MESLAVRYRPNNFKDVIGQDIIVRILQNQISSNDIRQGYLFCGSSGSGKTSTARIFAKQLKAHVVEIDAASNNGVDNIREIRELCKFLPMGYERTVYIIDEVHMLSTGAFNALLKTLEEPPPHVVFIMCTTDPQKVPATIHSRCQRFEFKRVKTQSIFKLLERISVEEDFKVDTKALELIASISVGGVRDAISLLDTCVGYCNNGITEKDVRTVTGTVSFDTFIKLIGSIAKKHTSLVSDIVECSYTDGKDIKIFVRNFIDFVVEAEKIKQLTCEEYFLCARNSFISAESNYTLTKEVVKDVDCIKLFKRLCELHKFIQYDQHPKNIVIGWLMNICLEF